jgi:SPP1 family phage portal protein
MVMGIFDSKYQEEIIRTIQAGNPLPEIFDDLIAEHAERAAIMIGLYNRSKMKPASEWSEDMLSTEFDGIPILARKFPDSKKVNHRLPNQFGKRITKTLVSYMANDIRQQIDEKVYSESDREKILDAIKTFNRNTSADTKYSQLVGDCANMGTSYIYLFQHDAELKSIILHPWETIVIRDQSIGVTKYAMRYWDIEKLDVLKGTSQTLKRIEWFDETTVSIYISDGEGSYELIEQKPHFMGYVPVVEFPKNPERLGDVELTLALQDAYDISLSDLSAEVAQLRLAYLVGQSVGKAIDTGFLEKLKQTGVLTCDENGKWYFVEKNLNSQAIMELQGVLKKNIFLLSNSVDFSDPEFSGNLPILAFKLKTKPLEESAKETELMFKESLREMWTIIKGFWERFNKTVPKFEISDLSWIFSRNLPVNEKEEAEIFNMLDGKISKESALSRLSFIGDIQEEIERIETEKENEVEEIDRNPFESNSQMTPAIGDDDNEDDE